MKTVNKQLKKTKKNSIINLLKDGENMKFKIIRHFMTILKHKHHVFFNCIKCGIPFRGFLHDFSKFSPTEFINSCHYFIGTNSPVYEQRKDNDLVSTIALHHTGRNRHHWEYWVDFHRGNIIVSMFPYKYAVEYFCDMIAASRVYNGKSFKREMVIEYWNDKKQKYYYVHPKMIEFVTWALQEYANNGFKYLKKKDTKKKYNELMKDSAKVVKYKVELEEL